MVNSTKTAAGLSLSQIVRRGKCLTGVDIRVKSCCNVAEQCQDGDLFVAIDDGTTDGHEFVDIATERGASAVVVERFVPTTVPQFVVDDTRIAYGDICHALAGRPSDHLCTVGVAGTYGKTTTQMLIAGILEASGGNVGALGSLGYCDGEKAVLRSRTTPNSPEMMSWLRQMRLNHCTHAVIEATSESLARRQFSGLSLDAAVITNIRRGDISFHQSMANYRRAIQRITEPIKSNGFAVLNADDPGCQAVIAELSCPVMTFSTKHQAEVTAEIIERHKSEQTFLLHAGLDCIPVRTHMIGDQHVENCLAAACVALTLGIDLPTIAKGIESVTELPSRMERVECGQEFGVFIDSSLTPESLAQTLSTLRSVTPGRILCVASPQQQLASVQRACLGRVLERNSDECILTEDVEAPDESHRMLHDVLDGFDRPAQARLLPNRAKAICFALGEAQAGDTVLLAGCPRNATTNDVKDRTRFFDRDVAKYWLRQVGSNKVCPWVTA